MNCSLPTVRFSSDDLTLFSAASHDKNPLHLSAEFARRTCYGQELVFGILGAFACLSNSRPPLGCNLLKITLDFQRPIYLDVDYELTAVEETDTTRSVSFCDGSKVLLTADLTFAKCEPSLAPWCKTEPVLRQAPMDSDEQLRAGSVARGEYAPCEAATRQLLARFAIDERSFGRLQLSALLWSSYLVGMEQPGLRAVFHKLTLCFEQLEQSNTANFFYEAQVISLTKFNMLRSKLRLSSKDQAVASGESIAFVTPRSPRGSVATVASLLPLEPRLEHKVALVVGASRGLGAMLTTALALQGCTVLANFKSSDSDACHLQESLAGAPGTVALVRGDAADLSWCEKLRARISAEFGQLDLLICNACPSLRPLHLEAKMVERINSYISQGLALVSVPLSVFLGLVDEACGWSVIVSSVSVDTTPREWPHYVSVKYAIEGLSRVAALQYPKANFLLVRPPRLKTDLTNDPLPHGDAMPTEVAASQIIQRLQHPAKERIEVFRITR